ncbi:MAG: alpha-mannosidase [bacterium]|nr:MAG: alpha-mannosidase [bacterium]
MKFYYNKHTKTQLSQLLERIATSIYEPIADLEITAWRTKEPVPFLRRKSGEKLTLKIGDKWGDLFDCAWFYFTGEISKKAAGKRVVLIIDLSGEALVVDPDGNPLQCLTTGSSAFDIRLGRPGKTIVPFVEKATGDEKIELWVDAGNNDLFGNLRNNGTVQQASIAICHPKMQALYYDYEVLLDLLQQLPENSSRYQRILYALYRASIQLNSFTEKEARAAQAELAQELAKKNGNYSLKVSAIGHAHLDLAWLWPIRETIRKGARTFSNALTLMDRYPDFKFGASQAQLYQWMKERYPSLYQKIKSKVSEVSWDLFGATWVEPDTNMTGGEALIRQFLYGKRFFRQEFDKDIKILFLPDSFGYTAALPQIMKKCGVDYFVTIKLSWDRFNQYPHHSFFWQGIDGSEVLVHTPPEGTYNSSALPQAIKKAEVNYMDKAVSENCLMIYGIGNGGGGPGFEHLERLKREKNLAGMASVKQEDVLSFFNRLKKDKGKFHSWIGELYLGIHQGTYTTQGRNKWFNRKLELGLRELEYTSILAKLFAGQQYNQPKIEQIWKEVLLYQFHDILPGSSITRVYDESFERYKLLYNNVKGLNDFLKTKIFRQIEFTDCYDPIVVSNSLSWQRKEWIKVDEKWYCVEVPAMGYTTIEARNPVKKFPKVTAREFYLENDLLRIQFDRKGNIISIFDIENGREFIQHGKLANLLSVYHDDGDAWDFSVDYEYRKAGEFKFQWYEAVVDGPKAIHKQIRRFGKSKLEQKIVLTAGSRRLDFETQVTWNESNKMLRASFPVDVHATESVSEIQFGHIRRPNHQNTSWESAKFEICAHKWIDISQTDYGVALLNDSKYGHKVVENVLDINLLRSPQHPDPKADQAVHEFTYSLFPHRGNHLSGKFIQAGYELNIPLEALAIQKKKKPGNLPQNFSFISVDVENVIFESVKKAEDNDDIILRLYEAYGMSNRAKITLGIPVRFVYLTNMLEENISELVLNSNSLLVDFKPFEIKTVRLKVDR